MNVMRIEVRRGEQTALITRNRMRVDLVAEFFVRVGSSKHDVASAAQTLGRRSLQPEGIRELLEGKFSAAMRTIAAQMTLEEMHELRGDYARQVKEAASEALAQNGLELESVAIVDLDQTSLEFFDPSNAFDAEGLTQLTGSIERRAAACATRSSSCTLVDIRNQNLETQRKVLEIDRETEYAARLEQGREGRGAARGAAPELAKRAGGLRDQELEQAQLSAREIVEKARLAQERSSITEERIKSEEDTQRREGSPAVRALDEAELRSREMTERLRADRPRARGSRRRASLASAPRASSRSGAAGERSEIVELERQIARLAEKGPSSARPRPRSAASRSTRTARPRRRGSPRTGRSTRSRVERERMPRGAGDFQAPGFRGGRDRRLRGDRARLRITAERGVEEAKLIKDRDPAAPARRRSRPDDRDGRDPEGDRDRQEDAGALVRPGRRRGLVRAKVIQAEEQSFTLREREIAERRKLTDLIGAQREAEREARCASPPRPTPRCAPPRASRRGAEDRRRRHRRRRGRSMPSPRRSATRSTPPASARSARRRTCCRRTRAPGACAASCSTTSRASSARASSRWRRSTRSRSCTVDGINGGEGGGSRNVTDEVSSTRRCATASRRR